MSVTAPSTSAAEQPGSKPPTEPTRERWRVVFGALAQTQERWPIVQVGALAVVLAIGASTLDGLLSGPSIRQMLVLAALVGLSAAGQTLVIQIGGLDLSTAGMITASGLAVTQLPMHYHLPFGVIAVPAVLCAGLIGAGVGYLCHRFRLAPLIITLGVGTAAVGLVQVQSSGYNGTVPNWLSRLASPAQPTFGLQIPPLVVIWVVVAIGMFLFLRRSAVGRRLFATGVNRDAADLALVRTRRLWMGVFAFSMAASACVGMLVAGFSGGADGSIGQPYLFQSLAAVVIGGTTLGGRGDYNRTVIGALLVQAITTVLIGNNYSSADEQILFGLAILCAVLAYGRERRIRDFV